MLLVSYQPASQRQMDVLLTCAKNDHVRTDNRTLTVDADGVRAKQRAKGGCGPERSKALQPDWEKLPYAT